jgi:glycosyltransferase involved in cell wall biosynthesis
VGGGMSGSGIVMILSGFPRHSETFAINEILALEQRGALAAIFATKAGEPLALQPSGRMLNGRVRILSGTSASGQADEIIHRLAGTNVNGVHGYFAHFPAEVAEQVAARMAIPYSFSIHAKDARKVDRQLLAARARQAACVVACNRDVAGELNGSGAKVFIVPHGVDLERFHPEPFPGTQVLRILAVGRLVEKKGFHVLVEAAARLRIPFRITIAGEGPEQKRLEDLVRQHWLGPRLELCGATTHDHLPGLYGSAHLLVAPSIVDHTGDRDGLPNVVLEAMACGRPVIGSTVGAIATAVVPHETGLLVPPNDAASLAAAIEELGRDPAMLRRLGENARQRVERDYDMRRCTDHFCDLLRTVYE